MLQRSLPFIILAAIKRLFLVMIKQNQQENCINFDKIVPGKPFQFEIYPNADACDQLSTRLGILKLRKLNFSGTIKCSTNKSWLLEANLGATIGQSCVVTLDPVRTRIDTVVKRKYYLITETQFNYDGKKKEVEVITDEVKDIVDKKLYLADLLKEVLSLEIPDYPRSKKYP